MKHFDIIIVGGGFCGLIAAKQLAQKLADKSIALIEPRNEFEYTPGIIKLITNKNYAPNIALSYASVLKRTVIFHEHAKFLKQGKIITNKNSYSYKFALICSGASTPCSLKGKNVFVLKSLADAKKIAKALPNAKSVVIAGGGLVGVEVAGELCTKTDKKVTIVEPDTRLLSRNPESVSHKADRFLKHKGCIIVYGQRVVELNKGIVFTNLGTRIHADIVIWCAGIGVDTVLKGTSYVNERGCIIVDEHLRVKGLTNVFAGGDITNVAEEKTAQAAEAHAKIVIQNIIRTVLHKSLKKYTSHSKGLVISMGDWNGLFVQKQFCLSGFIPSLMKKMIEIWILRKMRA